MVVALVKTFCRYDERVIQNVLKYSLEKPSGPGDFLLGKVFITDSISYVVKGPLGFRSWSSEREGRFTFLKNDWILSIVGWGVYGSLNKL